METKLPLFKRIHGLNASIYLLIIFVSFSGYLSQPRRRQDLLLLPLLQDVPHQAPPPRALKEETQRRHRFFARKEDRGSAAGSRASFTTASAAFPASTTAIHPASFKTGAAAPPSRTSSAAPRLLPQQHCFGISAAAAAFFLPPSTATIRPIPHDLCCDRQRPRSAPDPRDYCCRVVAKRGGGRGRERGVPDETGLQLLGQQQLALSVLFLVILSLILVVLCQRPDAAKLLRETSACSPGSPLPSPQ
jgi:hypothetical protein